MIQNVTIPLPVCLLLILVVGVASVFDYRSRRIPNVITVPALLAGLLLNLFLSGASGLQWSTLGLLVAVAIYLPLYALRAIGAGDVKLMAAVGAIAGPSYWIAIFLATSVFGGIAALLASGARGKLQETWFNTSTLIADLMHFRAPYKGNAALDVRSPISFRLPHGTSIAAGTSVVILLTAVHIL